MEKESEKKGYVFHADTDAFGTVKIARSEEHTSELQSQR